jgi:isoleucyl-tRNA synthetase
VQPNFKRLGPRVGKLMPAVKKAFAAADGGKLLAEISSTGKSTLSVEGTAIELDEEDVQVRLQAKPGWAAAQGQGCVVVLSTELTDELIREGIARDLIRLIQDRRKALECEYADRIVICITTEALPFVRAIAENGRTIAEETLANGLFVGKSDAPDVKKFYDDHSNAESTDEEIAEHKFKLAVAKATS